MNFCKCGCGKAVKKNWAQGHKQRVDNIMHYPGVKEKMAKSKMGKKPTKKQLLSLRLGSLALTGKHISDAHKEIMRRVNTGVVQTEERKRKGAASRLLFYKSKKGKDLKKILSKKSALRWKNPEYRKKVLGRRPMSFFEKCVQSVITKFNFSYKFVGNGDMWIGRYNPDFISTKDKSVIEVYGSFQKKKLQKIKNYEKYRGDYFKKYGFKTLFLNELDIKRSDRDLHLFNKIGGFVCLNGHG